MLRRYVAGLPDLDRLGRIPGLGVLTTVVLPLGVALLLAVALFYPAWLQGRIYIEPDTVNYYYPALRTWQEWLRRGELLLWTPHTLSGFPLFAEGEVGMLYPPHALLLLLLPFDAAFVLIPIIHLVVAAIGAYLLALHLTGSRAGALVGGLAYGFGGLMVAQLHHTDVHSGFAWLPWVFWSFERARQAGLRAASPWLVATGAFLTLQLLTVHPQVPLTTLFGLSIYAGVSALVRPNPVLERLGGVARAAVAICLVTIGAIGVAAAQLIPLAEVGLHSQRTNGWDYARATEYSQSVWNLITTIFPLFYFDRVGLDWGQWVRWEAPMYVGIPTLAFALIGLCFGRSRARFAFGALAVIALWISFADYALINLHWLLFQLPGFSVFRAPGRFAVLYDLSAAMLAAHGVAVAVEAFAARRRGLKTLVLAWTAGVVAVPVGLLVAWGVLRLNRDWSISLLQQSFLALRRGDGSISVDRVLSNFLDVLAFWSNGRTAAGVGLLILTAALLWAWWRRPQLRIWPAAVVILLAGDLLLLGTRYHGTAPIAELPAQSEAAQFVIEHRGLHRVLSAGDPNTKALRLLPFETSTVGGDSSLQTATDAQLAASVIQFDNGLLDLWNVRYVAQRKGHFGQGDVDFHGPAWYERTMIDPERPLVRLVSGTPEEQAELRYSASFRAVRLRLASHLRFAAHVEHGAKVGEIIFRLAGGETVTTPIRAGIHTAEWAAARPDVAAQLRHQVPPVAFRYANDPEQRVIYYGELPVPLNADIESYTLRATDPDARIYVNGLAFVAADGRTWQASRYDKTRYRIVAEDAETIVYENLTVLPRAFLVSSVSQADDEFDALNRMRQPEFDPRSHAIVEGSPPVLPGVPLSPADSVAVEAYEETYARYVVSAVTDRLLVVTDTMFPGWTATIDGVPAPIWTTNGQYRGVRVPPGVHIVEFRFQPASLRIGLIVSALAITAVLAYLGLALRVRANERSAYLGGKGGLPSLL